MDHPPRKPKEDGSAILARPDVEEARAFLRSIDPWVLEKQVELTAVPAPPFGEDARGKRMAELFGEVGLRKIRMDRIGNVLGEYASVAGGAPAPEDGVHDPLILSAHLDTVFPAGTDVAPRREGGRIQAPGICDDGRGLAALLALARVLTSLDIPLPFPVRFLATVGEEGAGNLRGVRHFFAENQEDNHPIGFISLDGVGMDRITHRGIGSTRLRITLRGPGGHSWTNWGRPNPIHALGRIVTRAQSFHSPPAPKTTLTFARWGGGKSINAIPQEAWVEVDLRSEGILELEALEEKLLELCEEEAGRSEGDTTRPGGLRFEVREIGRRPAGSTEASDPLVRAAVEATRILGEDPILVSSSTDANLPMALGVPAITLGAGGAGGGIHTVGEWYENRKGPEGILRTLLVLFLLGG